MISLLTSLNEFLGCHREFIDSITVGDSNLIVRFRRDEKCLIRIQISEADKSNPALAEFYGRWEGYRLGRSDLRDSDTPEVDSGGGSGCATKKEYSQAEWEVRIQDASLPTFRICSKLHCTPKYPHLDCPIHGRSTDPDAPEASPSSHEPLVLLDYPEPPAWRVLHDQKP